MGRSLRRVWTVKPVGQIGDHTARQLSMLTVLANTRRSRHPGTSIAGPTIALLVSAACGGPASEQSGDWVVERDTVGDTIVVRTLSGSVWGVPMELNIDLSIGTLDGDSTLMFGSIQAMTVDADGGIYAFDSQVPALRYFNARGEYVRTLGREGSGPGEYRDAALGLAVRSDGRVVMRDPRNGRLNVYEPDGTPSDHWPVASGLFTSNAMVLDSRDHIYLKILLGRPERNKPWPIGLLHYDATGELVDTIPPPAIAGEPTDAGGTFLPSKVWALSPQGAVVVGTNDKYAFELRRPDGTVVRIERTVERVSLEPGERAEHEAVSEWTRRNRAQFRTADIPPVPATKPFYRGLYPGERGRVWVRRYTTAEKTKASAAEPDPSQRPALTWREPTVYDVFESDGTYLGEVHVPARMSLQVFRGDTVWGTRLGEFDEPYLIRAVITASAIGREGL